MTFRLRFDLKKLSTFSSCLFLGDIQKQIRGKNTEDKEVSHER